jgi:hypothetical protein
MDFRTELKSSLESGPYNIAEDFSKIIESDNFNSFKEIQSYCSEVRGITASVIQTTLNQNNNLSFDEHNGFTFRLKRASHFAPEVSNEEFGKKSWVLHKNIILSFWQENPDLKNAHDELTSFSPFEDLLVQAADRSKFLMSRRLSTYNVTGWANYFQELYALFYRDFFRDLKSRKADVRFVKELDNGYYFGFEYDSKLLQSEIRRGSFHMPDFKVVLLAADFKRNTKVQFKTFDEVGYQLLSKLAHPFSRSLIELGSYAAIKCKEEGLDISDQLCREERNGDQLRFTGNQDFGEHLKEYLFIYLYYQSQLNKNYLRYFENGARTLEG